MHVVAVLAPDGVIGFDLSTACQVFAAARLPSGDAPYEVRVCGDRPVTAYAVEAPVFELRAPYPLCTARTADTLVVPGLRTMAAADLEVLDVLRSAAARGARIASICTGAFLLAEAGLLRGRTATTHWRAAEDLARYPDVAVDPSVLFVDCGDVLTSAGVAAGLDMCLHLVSTDHGAAVAANAARTLVVPPRRAGGQAQFIQQVLPDAADGDSLQVTLEWLRRNLHRPVSVGEIAQHAGTSVRTLHRRFAAQVGSTPLAWLLQARVERARELLETSDMPVERIAGLAGFGAAVTMRAHFAQRLGTSPAAYRAAFRRPTGVVPARVSGPRPR